MGCTSCKDKKRRRSSAAKAKAKASNPRARPVPTPKKATPFRGGNPFPEEECISCDKAEEEFEKRISLLRDRKVSEKLAALKQELSRSNNPQEMSSLKDDINSLELYSLGLIDSTKNIDHLINPIDTEIHNLLKALQGNKMQDAPMKG